jgi:hypothetical protein
MSSRSRFQGYNKYSNRPPFRRGNGKYKGRPFFNNGEKRQYSAHTMNYFNDLFSSDIPMNELDCQ